MHIVDDSYLQGILANMKQKKWWKENAPDNMYKNDYIVALICHGFSWSFMIMLPLAIYHFYTVGWVICIIVNTIIHCFVDNLKANHFKINLIQDQTIHLFQIIFTCAIYTIIF